jgi:hypothetical protein
MRALRLIVAFAVAASLTLLTPSAHASAPTTVTQDRMYEGAGDDIIRIKATKARGVITFTHDGESNFAVQTLNARGKYRELLVNRIGAYAGMVVYNVYPGDSTAIVKITADGAWTAVFSTIAHTPLWKNRKVSSAGDKVVHLAAPTRGMKAIRVAHTGKSNFVIYAYTGAGSPELLVNRIGRYSGRVVLPYGTRYVSVMADGNWYLRR